MKRSEAFDRIFNIIYTGNRIDDITEAVMQEIEVMGMLAPKQENLSKQLLKKYPEHFEDDGYHGIVCIHSWRDYNANLPNGIIKYVEVCNHGEYSKVQPKNINIHEWEPENEREK